MAGGDRERTTHHAAHKARAQTAHHVMLTSINVDRVARLAPPRTTSGDYLVMQQALQDELPGEDVAAGDLGIAHML